MEHPKQILEKYGLEAKKSLGQNFLSDENILNRIVAAADLQPGDEILEVGPGLGSLTMTLASRVRRVVAVELDNRLLPILQSQLSAYPQVEIVHGDILKFDPAAYFAQAAAYKVVANVPYYITGGILRHLLTNQCLPQRLVLTVQKEVAERLTAPVGDLSLLAISVLFYGQTEYVTQLPAGAFWPRPNVDSAVIVIDSTKRPVSAQTVTDETLFFEVVRAGFSQKRKQIHKNLLSLGQPKEQTQALLASAHIDPQRRAETLTIEEWIQLYHLFAK